MMLGQHWLRAYKWYSKPWVFLPFCYCYGICNVLSLQSMQLYQLHSAGLPSSCDLIWGFLVQGSLNTGSKYWLHVTIGFRNSVGLRICQVHLAPKLLHNKSMPCEISKCLSLDGAKLCHPEKCFKTGSQSVIMVGGFIFPSLHDMATCIVYTLKTVDDTDQLLRCWWSTVWYQIGSFIDIRQNQSSWTWKCSRRSLLQNTCSSFVWWSDAIKVSNKIPGIRMKQLV